MSDAPDSFEKTTVLLPPMHGWKCKEGNNLFVADRGAVAFEIPHGWVVRHDQKQTLTFHDKEPPADQARISLTVFHLPPVRGGWKKLPLEELYRAVAKQESEEQKQPPEKLDIHHEPRPDMELIWSEKGTWNDPENGNPIRCRQLLARARLVQSLITFDVYEEAAEQFEGVWKDLLETLKLAIPRDLTGQVGN